MNKELAELVRQWQRQPLHVAVRFPVVVTGDDPDDLPWRIAAIHDPEFIERERNVRAQQGDG